MLAALQGSQLRNAQAHFESSLHPATMPGPDQASATCDLADHTPAFVGLCVPPPLDVPLACTDHVHTCWPVSYTHLTLPTKRIV